MYFTLYFCGYSLKVLLLNDDLKKYDLYITPWLGIGAIILVFFPLSWMGVSVRSAANYFIVAVAGCNLAVYLRFREGARFERGDAISAVLTCFIVASLYGGILAAHDFGYCNVFTNTDFVSYLNDARAALISSAKFVRLNPEGIPHWRVINLSLNFDFRGCVFIYAFFSALYNQSLLRIMYFVSAFAMFLNVMTFRLFLKEVKYTPVLCVLLCLTAFNSFFQKLVFQVFLGQLFSMGLVMVAFFTGFYLSEREKFDIRGSLLLVFMLTVNSLNYIEGLAYPIVPLAIYGFVCLLRKTDGWKAYWKNMLFVGTVFAILNFLPIYNFFRLFLAFGEIFPGWATHMATLMDVAGLHGAFESPDLLFAAALMISNAVIVCVILYQMRREGHSSFLSIACVSYILLYIAFCAVFFRIGSRSSYNAFKGALSMSFILVIFMLRFFEKGLNGTVSWMRGLLQSEKRTAVPIPPLEESIATVIFVLFFSMNAISTSNDLRFFYTSPSGLGNDGDIIEAYAESSEYGESDFVINSDSRLCQLDAAYRAPWGRAYTSGYGEIDGDSERVMKDFIKPGDIYVTVSEVEMAFNTSDAAPLFENGTYKISRFEPGSLLFSDYAGASHKLEFANTPMGIKIVRRLTDEIVGYEIMSLAERNADMTVTFFDPEMAALEITVFVNGEEFGAEYTASDKFIKTALDDVPLNEGVNSLHFKISGDISMMSIAAFELQK
jgi:hypothetical protein